MWGSPFLRVAAPGRAAGRHVFLKSFKTVRQHFAYVAETGTGRAG